MLLIFLRTRHLERESSVTVTMVRLETLRHVEDEVKHFIVNKMFLELE